MRKICIPALALILCLTLCMSGTAVDSITLSEDNAGLTGRTFLVLGDSYTAAHGLSSPSLGWTYVMADRWNMTQYNYSISGSTVTAGGSVPMVERVFDLPDNIQPDFVILQGGSNDRSQNRPIGDISDSRTDTFCGALNITLDTLEEKYPDAVIVCFTPWINESGNYNDLGLQSTDYISVMLEICAQRNILCYNASDSDANGMHLDEEWFRTRYCLAGDDYYHLNEPGSAMFAVRFGLWLQKNLYGTEPADRFYDLGTASEDLLDAVSLLSTEGVMNGTGTHLFSPTRAITREILAVTLYRMAGSPESAARTLTDVAAGSEAFSAVCWGMNTGIFSPAETFSPDDFVTREVLATALYRYYTLYAGGEVTSLTGTGSYRDGSDVSEYARIPMGWALNRGIISDTDGLLKPGALVSRSQLALCLWSLQKIT